MALLVQNKPNTEPIKTGDVWNAYVYHNTFTTVRSYINMNLHVCKHKAFLATVFNEDAIFASI